MTNQASELHELCKKVYELTGWDRYLLEDGKERYIDKCYWSYDGKLMSSAVERYKLLFEQFECPLYTSDYLLEKLPATLNDDEDDTYRLTVHVVNGDWLANYAFDNVGMWHRYGDTPLKALLKLTIALSEAGELK